MVVKGVAGWSGQDAKWGAETGPTRFAANKPAPRSKSHGLEHQKLVDELKEAHLTGLPNDVMV